MSETDERPFRLGDAIKNARQALEELDDLRGYTVSEMIDAVRKLRDLLGSLETEASWQWCYVEKWADGSGVYDRVTFDSEVRAFGYLGDNAKRVYELNHEFDSVDEIIASIEKRRTYEPGEWMPVEGAKS